MLYRVPAVLRQTDLARQIPALLAQLADWPDEPLAARARQVLAAARAEERNNFV